MSEFSFPFTGGASGDDGPYSAPFFAEILENLFRQNPTSRADASVLLGSGNGTDDALEVTETSPASNNIEIKEGTALIQGYYYYNDSDLNLLVSPNTDSSGFDRIDIVALEIDFINQVVRAKMIEGTASGSPVAPTLTKNASVYQVPIAEVEVANLFTTILDADIDNTVKKQSTLWSPKQGGTGIEGGYSLNDIIGANGVDSLEAVNIPEYTSPVGGSSGIEAIDRRFFEVYGATYTASNGYSPTKNSFTTLNLPTDYLYSPSIDGSGRLVMPAGKWLVLPYVIGQVYLASASNIGGAVRLYNNTTASVITQAGDQGGGVPVSSLIRPLTSPTVFTTSENDELHEEWVTNASWYQAELYSTIRRWWIGRVE